MQDRLKVVKEQDKEILQADFSHLKEGEMIQLMMKLVDQLIADGNLTRVLITKEGNFFTPKYMEALRSYRVEERTFHIKTAIVGFNDVQKWILKGYNSARSRDVRAFDSREEALNYLLAD